jgi:hypothetical protein
MTRVHAFRNLEERHASLAQVIKHLHAHVDIDAPKRETPQDNVTYDLIADLVERELRLQTRIENALIVILLDPFHFRAITLLTSCQEAVREMRDAATSIRDYEAWSQIQSFPHGDIERKMWITSLAKIVSSCKAAIEEIDKAILLCWQELAEDSAFRRSTNSSSARPKRKNK